MSSVRRLPELLTGRRSAWLVLVTALLVSSLAFLLPPNDDADAARSGLPVAAESARAEALAAENERLEREAAYDNPDPDMGTGGE